MNPGQRRSHQDPKLLFIQQSLHVALIYHDFQFSSQKKNNFSSVDVRVLYVGVGFWVRGRGGAACCIVSRHRRPPGGNKSSTCNSEQSQLASVSTGIHSGLSVSPPTKLEFSPAKVSVHFQKHTVSSYLPCLYHFFKSHRYGFDDSDM